MQGSAAPETRPRASLRGIVGNVALVLVSLLACFAVLEVGVRLLVDVQEHNWPVHDLQPDRRIAFLPGSERTYENEELRFTLSTNRFGRRDVEWTPAMMADPRNILFVGDSMILGYGVEHESTIPSLLESRSIAAGRPLEVFNFGLPGGSPPDYLELLDEALMLGIRANTVLVGIFVGNDFYPGVLKPRRAKKRVEAAPQTPPPRSELIRFVKLRASRSPRVIGWSLTLGRLLGVTLYDTAGSYVFLRDQTDAQQLVFRKILEVFAQMKKRCDRSGRDLYGVIIPNKIQVENRDELTDWIYDAAKPNRMIGEYCDEIGIPCLDLLPVLSEAYESRKQNLYFPVDRHLTPAGTAIVAAALADFLARSAPIASRLPDFR